MFEDIRKNGGEFFGEQARQAGIEGQRLPAAPVRETSDGDDDSQKDVQRELADRVLEKGFTAVGTGIFLMPIAPQVHGWLSLPLASGGPGAVDVDPMVGCATKPSSAPCREARSTTPR